MKNLRVGLFLLHPNTWFGGGQMALMRVAQWLAGKGLLVEVIVSRVEGQLPFQLPNKVSLKNLNVPALKWNGRPLGAVLMLSTINGLARYLRSDPPSVVIAPGWADGSITLLARRFSKPSAKIAIWEQTHVSTMRKYGGNLYRLLAPQFVRWLYPSADLLVGCSYSVADDIADLANLPKEQVHTIYNPIPPDLFQKAEEPIEHPWFIDEQLPVILGVGRLDPYKDFGTLIKAFALVRQNRPARLFILGEGAERPKLEALVKQLKLKNDVSLPGFEPNPFRFMKRAAAFVLSSRYEGAPLVLAEALACGCPIVSTDCPSGPSEILEGGKWGKLVPVGDVEALAEAILETLENPPDREKLRERGMDFHIDKIGQKWLELINSLTQNW